jgi:hypothetical protein
VLIGRVIEVVTSVEADEVNKNEPGQG